MEKSESITKLASALVKAQAEFECVRNDSDNPFFKSKYASLGAMIVSTDPVLQKHGLAISQLPASDYGGMLGVETILIHESGEWISNTATIEMPDSKNPAQEAGKAITYLRRYGWQAVLGVYSGDDDDAQSLTVPTAKAEKKPRMWTAQQKAYLVEAELAENDFAAKGMLDLSILKENASKTTIVSWGKYYRASRDDDNTSDIAAMSANGKYAAAINQGKK